MLRISSILASLLVTTLAGCYDPDRSTPSGGAAGQPQGDSPADDPAADGCDADCQACASYCAVELVCNDEPPSAEDCAWNCLGWLEFGTPGCADAYREAIACIGDLDCTGYDDPSTCVPELQQFHAECDDEAAADVDEPLPLLPR